MKGANHEQSVRNYPAPRGENHQHDAFSEEDSEH
jgi:hypothetical protein